MSTITKNDAAVLGQKAGAADFPRVLIVHMSCINEVDSHGVSFRSWFHEWPREKLAQIYSGNEQGSERFCGRTFILGPSERRWGKLFFKLKESSFGKNTNLLVLDQQSRSGLSRQDRWSLFQHRLGDMLIKSGIWELIFYPLLSRRLLDWVNEFKPEVIYCQGYSLSFAWLPLLLKRRLNIPICFQTGDDWPDSLYRGSVAAWAIRPVVRRAIGDLVSSASVRFAAGDSMAAEYESRYGKSFETMMMCDDLERFKKAAPRRAVDNKTVSIVYAGGLGNERWRSLVELAGAAKLLKSEGSKVLITAFTSVVPLEAVNLLKETPHLNIQPLPNHEDIPAFLKGADILFLPEAFDSVTARYTHLSISTKAHLYMMAERPVLVYGSPMAGVVDYASREGWAYVVDRQDIGLLAGALQNLVSDKKLGAGLVQTGIRVARQNHDEALVRRRFLKALQLAAQSNPAPR